MKLIIIMLIAAFISSCENRSVDSTTNTIAHQETSYSTYNSKSTTLKNDSDNILGIWIVKSVFLRGISAVSISQVEKYIGDTIFVSDNSISIFSNTPFICDSLSISEYELDEESKIKIGCNTATEVVFHGSKIDEYLYIYRSKKSFYESDGAVYLLDKVD